MWTNPKSRTTLNQRPAIKAGLKKRLYLRDSASYDTISKASVKKQKRIGRKTRSQQFPQRIYQKGLVVLQ